MTMRARLPRLSRTTTSKTWRSIGLLWVALTAACASGPEVCQKDTITGSEHCNRSSGSGSEAAATAAIAGGAWLAVGCTVNGCEPPFRCNGKTKQCERISCKESVSSCPPAYNCDPKDNLCK